MERALHFELHNVGGYRWASCGVSSTGDKHRWTGDIEVLKRDVNHCQTCRTIEHLRRLNNAKRGATA